MNDTSQMGITIAGVAVVSAIAAVVFNKLNPETRKESYARQFAEEAPRSRSRQFGEEKGEDNYYDSDEGVEPRIKNRLQPGASFGSDFDDVQEQSLPDYVEAEPNASRQSFEDDFQSPSESLSGFSQGSSTGSSSGFASGLARSSTGSSSGFAPRSSSGSSSGSPYGK